MSLDVRSRVDSESPLLNLLFRLGFSRCFRYFSRKTNDCSSFWQNLWSGSFCYQATREGLSSGEDFLKLGVQTAGLTGTVSDQDTMKTGGLATGTSQKDMENMKRLADTLEQQIKIIQNLQESLRASANASARK